MTLIYDSLTRVYIKLKIRHLMRTFPRKQIYIMQPSALLFCFLRADACVYQAYHFHWTRSACTMTIRYIFIECFYRCPLFTHDSFLSAMISCRNVYDAAIHTHTTPLCVCCCHGNSAVRRRIFDRERKVIIRVYIYKILRGYNYGGPVFVFNFCTKRCAKKEYTRSACQNVGERRRCDRLLFVSLAAAAS